MHWLREWHSAMACPFLHRFSCPELAANSGFRYNDPCPYFTNLTKGVLR